MARRPAIMLALALASLFVPHGRAEVLPGVRIEVDRTVIAESNGLPAWLIVTRTGDTGAPLPVALAVTGTARGGRDFARLDPEVVIPAGETAVAVALTPLDDADIEPNETVTVTVVPRARPFSIVLLPDTQYYTAPAYGGAPEMFTAQTRWTVDNAQGRNIQFVLHEGDCTDGNTSNEWVRTKASMSLLDGAVPYAIAAGNHDGLGTRNNDTALFNKFFPATNYSGLPTFGGMFESNKMDNTYHLFSAGGLDWLVLALEFGPRNEVLAWADAVVTNHPQRKVILVTHTHIYSDNTLHGSSPGHLWTPHSYGRANDGVDVWEKLVRKHANMAFVFNGHVLNSGQGRLVGVGNHGNRVYQMLCNYQTWGNGGSGLMRVIEFFPEEDRLEARSFSPHTGVALTDPANEFACTNLGVFAGISSHYSIDPAFSSATVAVVSDDLDLQPPRLLGVEGRGVPAEIRLVFDEPLDPAGARDTGNFQVPGVPVTNSALSPDGRTVILSPAVPLLEDTVYSVSVSNLADVTPQSNRLTNEVVLPFTYLPVMLHDNFGESGLASWRIVDEGPINGPAAWSVANGYLMQNANSHGPSANATSNRAGTYAVWNDPRAMLWSNYTAVVDLRSYDDDGIGVMFRYVNPSNYYKFEMDAQRRFRKLFKRVNGLETTLAGNTNGFTPGLTYAVRIEASGPSLRVLIDGLPAFSEVTDHALPAGTLALYCWANTGARFDHAHVMPAYRGPTASIDAPTNGFSRAAPASITGFISVNDPDQRLRRLEVLDGGEIIRTLVAPPWTITVTNHAAHEYNLSLRTVDDFDQFWQSPLVRWHLLPAMPPPVFTLHPVGRIVPVGGSVLFQGRAVSPVPFVYQWKINGSAIAGATNSAYFINDVAVGHTGAYTLSAINATGERVSSAAELAITTNVPPVVPWTSLRTDALDESGRMVVSLSWPWTKEVRLEVSADLIHWVPAQSVSNAAGSFHLGFPADQPRLFFRARTEPD
jgi:hypothetical protein